MHCICVVCVCHHGVLGVQRTTPSRVCSRQRGCSAEREHSEGSVMSGVHCFSTDHGREGLGRIGLFRKGFFNIQYIIIIKLPNLAIASTPSAPRPTGAAERGIYSTVLCTRGTTTTTYASSSWQVRARHAVPYTKSAMHPVFSLPGVSKFAVHEWCCVTHPVLGQQIWIWLRSCCSICPATPWIPANQGRKHAQRDGGCYDACISSAQ
jgi:hypothetical protein